MADISLLGTSVDLSPETRESEVIQNIRTIIGTPKGSVPMDREFGVEATFLDRNMPKAQALIRTEIIEVVQRYEPRAEITKISFTGDGLTRKLYPVVSIKVVVDES